MGRAKRNPSVPIAERRWVSLRSTHPTQRLPSRLQPRIERARPRRSDRAWVSKLRAAIGEVRDVVPLEERSEGRIAPVEQIIDAAVELERLVDLIRGVNVEHRIARQPRRLVRFVTRKILAGDEQRVA